MRVLISNFSGLGSGLDTYAIELAKLLRSRYEVQLLALNNIYIRNVNVINIKLPRYPAGFPLLSALELASETQRLEKELHVAVVHEVVPPTCLNCSNLVSTRWGWIGYGRLSFIRISQFNFPMNIGGIPITLQHAIGDIISHRNAKFVIDVSRNSSNFIPPPVEIMPQKAYDYSDTYHILFVARDLNIRRKNLGLVIKAITQTKAQTVLHLVGRGTITSPSSKVKMVNHGQLGRGALIELMRNMDFLVLASTYEEVGYVGLEAYSVGLPVMASDIDSFNLLFKTSCFFNPHDPSELAGVIDQVSKEQLQKMGSKSRKYAQEQNSQAISRLDGIYSHLAKD